MSAENVACIKRVRRRLERWELTHLRELAASLHAQLEEMTVRVELAESAADGYWRDAEHNRELLHEWVQKHPGRWIVALTRDGQVHVVQEGGAA